MRPQQATPQKCSYHILARKGCSAQACLLADTDSGNSVPLACCNLNERMCMLNVHGPDEFFAG